MSIETQILQKALNSKYSSQYTNLKKIMKHLNTFLEQFIHVYKSKKLIDDSFFPNYKDSKCKFIYLSEIAEKTNTDRQYVCRKINCLCALNLLEKVDISKLNSVTITNTIKLAKSKGKEPPNYFFIPKYNKKLFLEAEDRATKLIENGFTMRNFNKAMVKIALGDEIAETVFFNTLNLKSIKRPITNTKNIESPKTIKLKNNQSNINILKHFNYLIVTNECDENTAEINVFYRPQKYIECIGYTNYLKKLNFRKLVLDFLGISSYIPNYSLTPLQNALKKYNYNSFSEAEQLKYKWLIYDFTAYCNISPYFFKNKKCYKKYFVDSRDLKKLKKYKDKQFIFNKNGYLILYPNPILNINLHQIYHVYVYNNFNALTDKKKKRTISIDHMQKPPIYLYDTSIKLLPYSSTQLGNDQITKKIVKKLLDYKIIESWNSVLSNKYQAKSNNCRYNLREVSCAENSRKTATIDKNNIIEIYQSPKMSNEIYVSFYFPEKRKLKVNGEICEIYTLSIKYNSLHKSYDSILSDLRKFNIPIGTGINYDNLFKYIQGKDILFIVSTDNNNYSEATSKTRTQIIEGMNKVQLVKSYSSNNNIFLQ